MNNDKKRPFAVLDEEQVAESINGANRQSESYTEKKATYDSNVTAKPAEYESKWQKNLDDTMSKILNREPFEYDVNGDALYNQYKDTYTRAGSTAMADTMARAASMTGGYGNSYAVSVGNQAYNEYMGRLNDVVPELYQLALDRYNAEGDALREQYAMYADMDERDYSRWSDNRAWDYQLERDAKDDERYDTEWQHMLDTEAKEDARYADETAYEHDQDAKTWEYQLERDAIEDARYAEESAYEHDQDAKTWGYQYAQDAKEDARDAEEKALESAYIRASLGDYAPLAKYYGISEAQAAQYWETQNATASGGTEYTNGDVMSAYNKLTSGATLTADDYDALLSAGYTAEEIAGMIDAAATSPYGEYTSEEFADKMYKLASTYTELAADAELLGSDVDDTSVKRALSLVHEAGDSEEAKTMFKTFFGDELYKAYLGVASQNGVTESAKQAAGKILSKDQFLRQGLDKEGTVGYEDFVADIIYSALESGYIDENEASMIIALVEEREGL